METSESVQMVESTNPVKPAIPWGWLRATLLLIVWIIVVEAIISGTVTMAILLIQGYDPAELMGDSTGIMEKLGVMGMTFIRLVEFGAMLFFVWIFRRFIDKRTIYSLGFEFKTHRNDLFAGMGWGIALMLIGFVSLWISGMLKITDIQFNFVNIFFYLILFIITAFNEEILMRGYILINLMDSMNKYTALIISSLIFSALHLLNPNPTIVSIINIFLAGILLGIYFIHKGNLWFPIGMHFTWNFFQGPVFGFEVSGLKTDSIMVQDATGHNLLTGGEFGFEGSLLATAAMIVMIAVIHIKYRKARAAV